MKKFLSAAFVSLLSCSALMAMDSDVSKKNQNEAFRIYELNAFKAKEALGKAPQEVQDIYAKIKDKQPEQWNDEALSTAYKSYKEITASGQRDAQILKIIEKYDQKIIVLEKEIKGLRESLSSANDAVKKSIEGKISSHEEQIEELTKTRDIEISKVS
jgi:hypothetical protein